jgi:hypothetical protein
MIVTDVTAEQERIDFVKRAAEHFASNPNHTSYSDGEIVPGAMLALRWGVTDRAVLLLKLDEYASPVVYGDAVTDAGRDLGGRIPAPTITATEIIERRELYELIARAEWLLSGRPAENGVLKAVVQKMQEVIAKSGFKPGEVIPLRTGGAE